MLVWAWPLLGKEAEYWVTVIGLPNLGEYLPYRFETIREKALHEKLAEKDAIIQKMEIQLEVFRETIRMQ